MVKPSAGGTSSSPSGPPSLHAGTSVLRGHGGGGFSEGGRVHGREGVSFQPLAPAGWLQYGRRVSAGGWGGCSGWEGLRSGLPGRVGCPRVGGLHHQWRGLLSALTLSVFFGCKKYGGGLLCPFPLPLSIIPTLSMLAGTFISLCVANFPNY